MPSNRPEQVAEHMIAKLGEARLKKNMSVKKLAWMSGVSPSAITFIERQERNPTLKTFLRLATVLELDTARLFRDAEKAVPPDK